MSTVVGLLAARAGETPHATAFTFGERAWSYQEVWDDAGRAASRFHKVGLGEGENALIALPNGPAFFASFYGALRAGAVAVPVFPGLGPEQLASKAAACDARLIVKEEKGELDLGLPLLTPLDWQQSAPSDYTADVAPDDVAFIQYTSGSTGEPQGVMITHRNLVSNIGQLVAGMAITSEDRFVSWLPTYHDMGLILMTMVPFALGAELALLPTRLRDVGVWLGEIERRRGTVTAAPDFAYRLCLKEQLPVPDLSSLRMALNAAEPVRAATIARFEEQFGLAGVMVAGYGLAEATVGVTTWPPGSTPPVDARGFVSVGPPFPGVEIRIAPDGEVLVASSANAAGYYREPAATAKAFGDDGYIRTGDLGHLDADGNLYITGRKKEIIIAGGRNLAPKEIIEIVDDRPTVRLAAAVGIDRGGPAGEQPHVFAEVRDVPSEGLHTLAVDIAADVWSGLGLRLARVHLLRSGTIPLTHNGKVRVGELADRLLDGRLAGEGAVLYPQP